MVQRSQVVLSGPALYRVLPLTLDTGEALPIRMLSDDASLLITLLRDVAHSFDKASIYRPIRRLIDDRTLYWVEAMNYRNRAYRLLVTDRDLSKSTKVAV